MGILTLRTHAQHAALTQAVDFMVDMVNDQLGEAEGLQEQYMRLTGTAPSRNVNGVISDFKKKALFLTAFKQALAHQPIGISCYLEGVEVEVLRTGLESLVDIEEDTESGIFDVLETHNIQAAIVKTSLGWGAVDPAALASELRSQVREALEGKGAAAEVLEMLS